MYPQEKKTCYNSKYLIIGRKKLPLSKQISESYYLYNGYPRLVKTQDKNYTRNYQNNNIRTINPFKKNQKRKLNQKGKFALIILLSAIFFKMTPFLTNNYILPVIGLTPNKNIKITNYNYIYNPITQKIYNSSFLNTKLLVEANKKPLMQNLYLTEELTILKNKLETQISQNPKIDPHIFVWDISNGNYVDIKGELPIPAASIIKLPVLISTFKAIESGKFQKENLITFEEQYRSSGSGSLQYKVSENTKLSVDELARIMITESDNTSTNILISLIGSMDSVNNDILSWGLNDTKINTWLPDLSGTNYTTAKDISTMLYNLDNEEFLNIESRANIFDYMGNVKNNRLLAAGIPPEASIAHKTGDIGNMLGDAGIIYSPNGKKYIAVILVKRSHNDYSAKEFISTASKTIYDYMTNI